MASAPDRPDRLPAAMRQARIMEWFRRDGYVSIGRIAQDLGVSGMTIRRDIARLERQGTVLRIHGGAMLPELAELPATEEPAFDKRMQEHPDEKVHIAAAAARLVRAGEVVGLDVGTSILALARRLTSVAGLRVITNNLRAATLLAEGGGMVYVPGGRIREPELSVIGPQALDGIARYHMDRVFIGVSGMDATGFSDYSPEDTEVKHAMMSNAAQVIVLCDSSKFGRRAMARVADFSAVQMLITDAAPPEGLAQTLRAAGTEVVVA